MKRKALFVVSAIILLAAIALIVKPEYGWLIFNGSNAEKYAVELLNGSNPKTPDWAIDLVVIKENGLVQFNEHNSTKVYVYSPNKEPGNEGFSWSHIWGAWYVGNIKT